MPGLEDFPGYDGRPVAVDDAALLLPMYEAHDLATVGTVDITLADVDMLVRDPRADLGRSLLLTRDGVAAGVLVPVRQSGSDRAGAVDLEIVAHPDHAALYAGLVDRAVAGLPQDARGDVWAMGPAEKEALRARGFRSTASHVRLHRDLAGGRAGAPGPRRRPGASRGG